MPWTVDVINILPHHQPYWSQLDRNCDRQISTTTRVVINNSGGSRNLMITVTHIPPPAHHRRHDHQIFGSKVSQLKTSQPVEKCNFYLYHLHLHPHWGWPCWNFAKVFGITKGVRGLLFGVVCMIPCLAVLVQCLLDGWTHGQTDGHTITANMALA